MKGTVLRTIGAAVAERATSGQAGRGRAIAAAVFAGAATAAATYKLLRG